MGTGGKECTGRCDIAGEVSRENCSNNEGYAFGWFFLRTIDKEQRKK